jgi:hypothetical protein
LFGWRHSGGKAPPATTPATGAAITDDVESEWLHALDVQLSGGDSDRVPAQPAQPLSSSSASSSTSFTPAEPIDDPPFKDERGYVWMMTGGKLKKIGLFLSCPWSHVCVVFNVNMRCDINHATDDVTELELWSTLHHDVGQHYVLSCLSEVVMLATDSNTYNLQLPRCSCEHGYSYNN